MPNNGNFLTFHEFITKYPNLKCNFMEFFSFIDAISSVWRDRGNISHRITVSSSQDDLLNNICKVDKVCKLIHKMCVKTIFKTPGSEDKWAFQFNDANIDWTTIYRIPHECTLSTKLRYFQYQFLLRYLPLNKFLFDIGIINSNLCTFCKSYPETLLHLFWECTVTRSLWLEIQSTILSDTFRITDKIVFFGILDPLQTNKNFVILHAKYFIYCE